MHRFFIFNNQEEPRVRIIPTDDLFHQLTKVLRIREKEEFICIYENLELRCKLDGNEIKVIESNEFTLDKNRKITLIQGMPTNKKVSLIVQKATELDVDHIVLWQSKRSTSKISDFDKKEDRLRKIIVEACEQSRRNDIPEISFIKELSEFNDDNSKTIVLYENEHNKSIKEAIREANTTNINLVIGPEGGIDVQELEELTNRGAIVASLGKNILRTETAAIAALAVTMGELE